MLPFLHIVLGHLTTLMMSVKGDNMRWVFAHCVAKFCESIIEYVANIERAPDRSVQKEAFSDQVAAIFDVIFNVWLQSKEPKVIQQFSQIRIPFFLQFKSIFFTAASSLYRCCWTVLYRHVG